VRVGETFVLANSSWPGRRKSLRPGEKAAHYHSPLSVGVGAVLALWAVAGIAVVGGHGHTASPFRHVWDTPVR
jgi:hypothetical protein